MQLLASTKRLQAHPSRFSLQVLLSICMSFSGYHTVAMLHFFVHSVYLRNLKAGFNTFDLTKDWSVPLLNTVLVLICAIFVLRAWDMTCVSKSCFLLLKYLKWQQIGVKRSPANVQLLQFYKIGQTKLNWTQPLYTQTLRNIFKERKMVPWPHFIISNSLAPSPLS